MKYITLAIEMHKMKPIHNLKCNYIENYSNNAQQRKSQLSPNYIDFLFINLVSLADPGGLGVQAPYPQHVGIFQIKIKISNKLHMEKIQSCILIVNN